MCVELWDSEGRLSFKILKYSLETKTDSLTQLQQSSRNASGLICLMANELAWRLILPEACYSNIMIIDLYRQPIAAQTAVENVPSTSTTESSNNINF